ncbi:ribosome-inactivating family protein [Kitasatospora sp. NPDC059088]|uniref:ribosome-inactivating family protein n=1 Tax=unclassified Kitasatospora TaxID=2633591 RepID=UPI0036C7BE23
MQSPGPIHRSTLFAVVLALLTCLFAASSTTAAQANTGTNRLFQIDWSLDGIVQNNPSQAAADYDSVITELRGAARGNSVLMGRMDDTEIRPDDDRHLIEVRLQQGGQHIGSVYFRSDNLYIMGIWTPSQNSGSVSGILGFSDQRVALQQILARAGYQRAVGNLNVGSSYMALGSAARATVRMGATEIAFATGLIHFYDSHSTATSATLRNQSYLVLIQALAEAARFEEIRAHVSNNLRTRANQPVPAALISWENQWSAVSRWLHQVMQDPSTPPFEINGTSYRTPQLLLGSPIPGYPNRIGYLLALGSSR